MKVPQWCIALDDAGGAWQTGRNAIALDASKIEHLANGAIRVAIRPARSGLLVYGQELRFTPAQVLTDSRHLASFRGNPITLGHPPTQDGLVSASQWSQYAIGYVEDVPTAVAQDAATEETYLQAHAVITEPNAVRRVQLPAGDPDRLCELSCGYRYLARAVDGIHAGQRYRTELTARENNHVALLGAREARAGAGARVVTDAKDSAMNEEQVKALLKSVTDAFNAKIDSLTTQLKAATDALTASDKAQGELVSQVAALKAAPVASDAVAEAVQLREDVRVLVKGEYPFGNKPAAEVRRMVVEKIMPGVAKDKSDAFVEGIFASEVARRKATVIRTPADAGGNANDGAGAAGNVTDLAAARANYEKNMRSGTPAAK